MKRTTVLLCSVLLAFAGSALGQVPNVPSDKGLDVVGPVPAATLLIPYFEVDVSDAACSMGNGRTTLFSVNNAGPAPTIAHVVFWSDQAIPVLNFDVYLTGYDVQTFNLYDVFCLGTVPRTGFAVSHRGSRSDQNVPFPSCNNTAAPGSNPVWGPGAITPTFLGHLKAWLTGKQSPVSGNCAASYRGDTSAAIGYITIDQVDDCTALFPSDDGYADVLGFDNVLWGDYFLIDRPRFLSWGFDAVPIQAADPMNAYLPGEHTFYGRYFGGAALDQREPLPTTTAARFFSFTSAPATAFFVWRETSEAADPYPCVYAGPMAWYPLTATNLSGFGPIIVFDEEENPYSFGGPRPPRELVPPNAANGVVVGPGGDYDTGSVRYGWIYQNLQSYATTSTYGDFAAQQYTIWLAESEGRYTVGLDAFQLDTANNPIADNP